VPTTLSVSGASDIGKVRQRNEDAIALDADTGIVVVADGMGGHPGGDIASRIAADTALDLLSGAARGLREGSDFVAAMLTAAEHAVLAAHERIRARGREEAHLQGMGTTLTALAIDPTSGSWVIGHVGDSRAYRVREGSIEQLTRDDTWVQQQIDNGVLGPEAARTSPYSHLLTQCLGLEEAPVPQVMSGRSLHGDAYLLCTDGLVGMLDHRTMRDLIEEHTSSDGVGSERASTEGGDEAVGALVEAANEAGGYDNITAALVRVSDV
jgi:protein phosphatase